MSPGVSTSLTLIERWIRSTFLSWTTDTGECVLAISTDVIAGERIFPPAYEHAGPATDRRGTAEILGIDECWALLAAEEVGRLAVIRGDTPLVMPINYAVDGRAILFRTDPGTKFHQGPRSKVSFEIDGLDHASQFGWSVVATGHPHEITPDDGDAFARAAQLAIQPWAGGGKRHMMRLVPTSVTGRRVGRLGPVRSPHASAETPDARQLGAPPRGTDAVLPVSSRATAYARPRSPLLGRLVDVGVAVGGVEAEHVARRHDPDEGTIVLDEHVSDVLLHHLGSHRGHRCGGVGPHDRRVDEVTGGRLGETRGRRRRRASRHART